MVFFTSSLLYTDKKIKFSSYIKKFKVEQLQSHIWLTRPPHIWETLRISSYIRKPFLIYDFAIAPLWLPYIWGKFYFLFYQCSVNDTSFVRYIWDRGAVQVSMSLAKKDTGDHMFPGDTGEGSRVAFFPKQIDIVKIGAEDKLTMK